MKEARAWWITVAFMAALLASIATGVYLAERPTEEEKQREG